jgi:hypothetical protein
MRTVTLVLSLAVGIAAVPLDALAGEASPKKIAVNRFKAKGVDKDQAAAIESQLCTELVNAGADVLCADDLESILQVKRMQLGLGACADEEACTKEIGNIAQANRVLNGELAKIDSTVILTVSLVEAESSKVLARLSEKTEDKAVKLLDKLGGMAKQLAAK